MEVNVSMENYEEEFEPSDYLKHHYICSPDVPPQVKHMFRCYHDTFRALPSGLRVLDYGAGPVMCDVIPAASKASEIVMAEYTRNNRTFLRQWLDDDPKAFDWSPYFSYFVQELEGKSEEEVTLRQELVRKVVKDVVQCDINEDPPIQRGYDQLYDVLITSFVLEGVSKDCRDFSLKIQKFSNLIKPGGTILYYGLENTLGYYPIGDRKFPNIHVTTEFALKAFKDAGFSEISNDKLKQNEYREFRFITGKKQLINE